MALFTVYECRALTAYTYNWGQCCSIVPQSLQLHW